MMPYGWVVLGLGKGAVMLMLVLARTAPADCGGLLVGCVDRPFGL
jgi:hypothetical protein